MPELPEVEVVRRGLARWVAGRTIASVEVLHPRAIRRHLPGASDFAARIAGHTVVSVRRRGKYLWLPLALGARRPVTAIIGHLGMSGQLLVVDAAAPPQRHLRVVFGFTDGGPQLRFVDQRTFGGLLVDDLLVEELPVGELPVGELVTADALPRQIAHIARDPLDPSFDDRAWVQAARRRQTGIKRALLDQTLISGIGNIYADEALWRARLHWARPTDTMTGPALLVLLGHVRDVLTAAVRAGGTSFDSLYVNVNGQSGYFDRSLDAYGRAGLPCHRCGAPIRRDSFMNRGSFSCPRCQPRPRNARS